MRKTLAVLALSLTGGTAMANETGTITFVGTVNAGGTCPIEVITPGGPGLPRVYLGDFRTQQFTAAGQTTPAVPFALRITPDATCVIVPNSQAFVTFTGRYGADPSGNLYATRSGTGYTTGLALDISQPGKGQLPPGTESNPIPLNDAIPTEMVFNASLETIAASVTEGQIESSVDFLVEIR